MHYAEYDVDVVNQSRPMMKPSVMQYSTIMKLYGKFHEEQIRGWKVIQTLTASLYYTVAAAVSFRLNFQMRTVA